MDVQTAESGADGGGDGGLQGTAGAADAFQHRLRQRRTQPFHDVDAGLLHVPANLHARRVHALPGRLGQFRPDAIPGNQRHLMHPSSPFTDEIDEPKASLQKYQIKLSVKTQGREKKRQARIVHGV